MARLDKVITIKEVEKEWKEKEISKTKGMYFGQYVKYLQSQGYTIIYTKMANSD